MEYSLFLHRHGAEPFVLSGPPARHLSHCPEGAANKPAQGKTTRAQASVVAALGQSDPPTPSPERAKQNPAAGPVAPFQGLNDV